MTVIKHRRDTSTNWASNNPILGDGEFAVNIDDRSFRVGDGTSNWSALYEYKPGALYYMGTWSAAGGSYPSNPKTGQYYVCSADGTVSAVTFVVGDWIAYNGSTWDKINNAAGGDSGGASTWTEETHFTATPASTSTLTMTEDVRGTVKAGMGLRYTISSVEYYGKVTAITASLLTVAGVPLSGDLTSLFWCDPSRVVQIDYMIRDSFADAAQNNLLLTDMTTYSRWHLAEARLVQIHNIVVSKDTGALQPRVNISVGGNKVCTSNSGAGTEVNTTWSSTVVDISTTNYVVASNAAIEVTVDGNSTNFNSKNLTISGVFVLI